MPQPSKQRGPGAGSGWEGEFSDPPPCTLASGVRERYPLVLRARLPVSLPPKNEGPRCRFWRARTRPGLENLPLPPLR
jgi:hypothetical protein